MGWIAYYPDGSRLSEDRDGRPVQDGNDGKLAVIIQEDYNHKVAVDLVNGVVVIDYESMDYQNGGFYFIGPKFGFYVCDETNIVGELFNVRATEPDAEGWYQNIIEPIEWRPIWFTRMTLGVPTKVIGLQATLPEGYGGKNVKKLISLFEDGRMGID